MSGNHNGMQKVKVQQTLLHSGPLPPPAELEAFARISPDFPERIMRMAEQEQQHRFELDLHQAEVQKRELNLSERVAAINDRNARIGMGVSLLVVLSVMATAAYCAYQGQPWPASVLGVGGMGAVVAAIMCGGKLKRQR